MRDEKRAETESVRQSHGTAKKDAVANIEGRTSIVLTQIGGIGTKRRGPRSVAVRIVQHVKAEQGELGAHAAIGIYDQLFLSENTVGLIFEEVANVPKRATA